MNIIVAYLIVVKRKGTWRRRTAAATAHSSEQPSIEEEEDIFRHAAAAGSVEGMKIRVFSWLISSEHPSASPISRSIRLAIRYSALSDLLSVLFRC